MTQTLEKPVTEDRQIARGHLSAKKHSPPAIILGGGANALSVVRNIARLGAKVYVINEPDAFVRHSRFCEVIDVSGVAAGNEATAWAEFLLSEEANRLHGSILLACSDAAIECICNNRDELSERYILDLSNPIAQRAMLNKLETYRLAVAAGVPTPKFWVASSSDALESLRGELVFPLIIKPRFSHVFEGKTGKKLIIANNFDEVASAISSICASGTECVLMEMIPGPDDRLCSYFTYLDEQSRPLFHFTKRIIRRYPPVHGNACYHITDWVEALPEIANRLFSHVGLRGLANVEFKLDVRDGQYKLIECNARFTASDCLVTRSGVNLAAFVYRRLAGLAEQPMEPWCRGLRLWDPIRDFQAHLELRKSGQSTLWRWLASITHRQMFPFFELSDPAPALVRLTKPLRKSIARWTGQGASQ